MNNNLVLNKNLSSVESMPSISKLMYEETIKKNFEIIQTFLKKFTIIFNSMYALIKKTSYMKPKFVILLIEFPKYN